MFCLDMPVPKATMQRTVLSLESGLQGLVAPKSPALFLSKYWQRRPMIRRGSNSSLALLKEEIQDFDLRRILEAVPDTSEVELHARHPLTMQPARDVGTLMALYSSGCQLYIPGSHHAALRSWVRLLSQDLGRLTQLGGRVDIYASRPGGGLGLHYDKNDNFTIQLAGRKRWTYGLEPALREPLHNYGSGARRPELATTKVRKPNRKTLKETTLKPGDVFYMPRGVWHETNTLEDSLSLNINLHPESWVEVVTAGVANLLSQDEQWRQTASPSLSQAASRLESLKAMIASLEPEDFLGGDPERSQPETLDVETRLRRNPLAWWYVEKTESKEELRLYVQLPADRSRVFQIPARLLRAMRWLTPGRADFALSELEKATGLSAGESKALVRILLRAGLLLDRG